MNVVKIEDIQKLILNIQGQYVLLDSDVAKIYGVETKDINRAVKNNPEKFPKNYIIKTTQNEKNELVKFFHRFNNLKHSTSSPKAFTEKGLYMLATILKSEKAIQTTISIIETFSKIRTLSRSIKELSLITDKEKQQQKIKQSGELIAEILEDDLKITDTETSFELNFAVLKFKHTIKKKK